MLQRKDVNLVLLLCGIVVLEKRLGRPLVFAKPAKERCSSPESPRLREMSNSVESPNGLSSWDSTYNE